MSEPRRFLVDPSVTEFERDLLASYSAEQPGAAARERAAAIAGVAVVGTIATAGVGAGAAGGVAAPKAVAAAVGMSVFVKVGVVATLVAAATVGVVVMGRGGRDGAGAGANLGTNASAGTGTGRNANANANANASANASANANANANAGAKEGEREVSPGDLPSVQGEAATGEAASGHGMAARAAASGPRQGGTLAEEIAAFDRARGALEAGNAARAVTLVDDYEARFPAGTFVQEAEVLRVKALVREGDVAGANRVGQRFLEAHPTSPHAARVRAILEPSNP